MLIVLLGLITLVYYWPASCCGDERDCFGPADADACDGIRKKKRDPAMEPWDNLLDAKQSGKSMGRE